MYFAAALREQPRRFHGHGSSGGWQIRRAENGLLKTNDRSECGSGCAMLWRSERKIGICKAIVRLLGGQSVRKPPGGRRCAHRVKISVGVIVSAKTCHPRPFIACRKAPLTARACRRTETGSPGYLSNLYHASLPLLRCAPQFFLVLRQTKPNTKRWSPQPHGETTCHVNVAPLSLAAPVLLRRPVPM